MKKFVVILSALAVTVFISGIASAQEKPAPTSVILKAYKAPLGGVKLDHAKHSKLDGAKCETCHHASKPEKPYPAKVTHQACAACHTKPAAAPMKTVNPFHVAMAKSGICIDCHAKALAAGNKLAPGASKCPLCHKKENL
jgi:hypothetical protein